MTRVSRVFLILALLGGGLFGVILQFQRNATPREEAARKQCVGHLKRLLGACLTYRAKYDLFPVKLGALIDSGILTYDNESLFSCELSRAKRARIIRSARGFEVLDSVFHLVNTGQAESAKATLIEARIDGQVVLVGFTDGSVQGEAMPQRNK